MTIRPMEAHEDKRVRDIFALCHPDWPSRVSEWYVAYPTVVIGDPELVGFTSCSISPSATGLVTLYGNDLCVLPTRRRQGLGWALAEARLALGRAVWATTFLGITEDANAAMIRIFERQGLHPCQHLKGYFPTGDGTVWAGSL